MFLRYLCAFAAAAVAVGALPVNPSNGSFYTYTPCNKSQFQIPLLTTDMWVDGKGKSADARSAIIVQHGMGRDFNNAFTAVTSNVNLSSTVVVAPNFYLSTDAPSSSFSWVQPGRDLLWNQDNDWVEGQDAVNAPGCSSYDVYDWIRNQFSDRNKYPNLERVSFVGHSDGGAFVSRYALISDDWSPQGIAVVFIVANAPTQPYFTDFRPSAQIFNSTGSCEGWNAWPYGTQGNITAPYVAKRWKGQKAMFKRYISRHVRMLNGDIDTRSRFDFGDDSCPAHVQGGSNRRDRGYDYWLYKALLAGAHKSDDVGGIARMKTFSAYARLAAQVKPIASGHFHHQFCVVPSVGHVAQDIWASRCGQDAIVRGYITKSNWGMPALP